MKRIASVSFGVAGLLPTMQLGDLAADCRQLRTDVISRKSDIDKLRRFPTPGSVQHIIRFAFSRDTSSLAATDELTNFVIIPPQVGRVRSLPEFERYFCSRSGRYASNCCSFIWSIGMKWKAAELRV